MPAVWLVVGVTVLDSLRPTGPLAASPAARGPGCCHSGLVTSSALLLAAAAIHLGFQLTVSLVVYPALADAPEDRWDRTHDAHSRRITPVVIVVYGLLVAACAWAVLDGPDFWTTVSVAAAAVAGLLTAFGAAPVHGRLGKGRSRALLGRLLRIDRGRTAAAVLCAVAAFLAAS